MIPLTFRSVQYVCEIDVVERVTGVEGEFHVDRFLAAPFVDRFVDVPLTFLLLDQSCI